MKQKVLTLLCSSGSDYVSGEKISQALNISRTAVWKHMETLREEGYVIASVPRRGYKLVSGPDVLNPGELFKGLKTKSFGRDIRHYQSIDSTNTLARKLAEEGAQEGTVVLAEQQTQGKGRMDRQWLSPAGGIWMSIILKPQLPPYRVQGITLVAAVAVVNAIKKVTGLTSLIKWPNDIYIEGRKVCGILTEMKAEMDRVHYIVMGIGLNANNDLAGLDKEVPAAGALSMFLPGQADRKALVREILFQLEENYLEYCREGITSLLDLWRENNFTLGQPVVLKMGDQEFSGVAVDITPEGGLLLRDESGSTKVFYSGDVAVSGY